MSAPSVAEALGVSKSYRLGALGIHLWAQIDGEDAGALDVEMEQSRAAAARRLPQPSVIQPSSMSSSMMAETVLGCRPEHRARSARDKGVWRRMS